MTQTYFAILTAAGEAKDAKCKAQGIPFKITAMAVGDGGGNLPVPDRAATHLVNELRRAPLNQLSTDAVNTNQIIAEQVIPENVGGWWIREVGLFDDEGNLIAIANCPPTYKPLLAEGSGRTQVVRMVLIMSSVNQVELKIDPGVVLATRQYVDDKTKNVQEQMGSGLYSKDYTRILRPAGGYLSSASQFVNGALQIVLPVGYNNTMLVMKVRIYNNLDASLYLLEIAGYLNKSYTGWGYVKALCAASGYYKKFDIRFGDIDGKCAIWIGANNASWNFPQVEILDVLAAYQGQEKALTEGWNLSFVTTVGRVTASTTTVSDAMTLQGVAPSLLADPLAIAQRDSSGKLAGDVLGAAASASQTKVIDSSRSASFVQPNFSPRSVRWDFVLSNTTYTGGKYAAVMTVAPFDGTTASTGECSYQMAFGNTVSNGGLPQLHIRNGIDFNWNDWYQVWHSGNLTKLSQLINDTGFVGGTLENFGITQTDGGGNGISLYGGTAAGAPRFGFMFAKTATFGQYGAVNLDWATYFTMTGDDGRGWLFRNLTRNKNVAAISNTGDATFEGSVTSLKAESFRAVNDTAQYVFYAANGTRTGFVQFNAGGYANFMQDSGTGMRWGTAGQYWMSLTASGRLFLGATDNGLDKLQVEGSISAKTGFRGSWIIPDVRASSSAPNTYQNAAATIEFKDIAKVDNPPASANNSYGYILTVVGYDASGAAGGGTPVQISFGDGLAVRQAINGTSWGAWRKLWHDGNLSKLSQLENDVGIFPSGTRMPFAQAAAPTGWTQDVSDAADNRMLRVVKTAGGGTNGTHSPIINNVVPAHTHGFTTGNESASHTHAVNDPGHTHPGGESDLQNLIGGEYGAYVRLNYQPQTRTGTAMTGISLSGQSSSHTHTGSTDNGSSATDWKPRYIDMIICTRN